jgi:hypothetical protein
MRGVHPARCQDRDHIQILARQELVNIVKCRNIESRRNGIGSLADGIANCNKFGALNQAASEQIGMSFCDTATSEQAKSDHISCTIADIFCPSEPAHNCLMYQRAARLMLEKIEEWNQADKRL